MTENGYNTAFGNEQTVLKLGNGAGCCIHTKTHLTVIILMGELYGTYLNKAIFKRYKDERST